MSYEPTNWKTGDIVTSDKLNKLENGVANSVGETLKLTQTHTEDDAHSYYTLDHTYAEIREALLNGVRVILVEQDERGEVNHSLCCGCFFKNMTKEYNVIICDISELTNEHYISATENGYPAIKYDKLPSTPK